MEKLDLKKTLKQLYSATADPVFVDIPLKKFLMLDGAGNPNTAQEYQDTVQALYSTAYTLKFRVKKEMGVDYAVMPLEGLWWAENMDAFTLSRKDDWLWTMMILQPDFITPEMANNAADEAGRKKDMPALPRIRFDIYEEGFSAQLLHLGPYVDEGPNIQRLHDFIYASEYELRGKHHEIYLSDPRRGDPSKIKTIIRQPVIKI